MAGVRLSRSELGGHIPDMWVEANWLGSQSLCHHLPEVPHGVGPKSLSQGHEIATSAF